MNKKKQLECELNCKATAGLQESIALDMLKQDKSISSLIEEEITDELKDTKQDNN